jgi:hypothetical protein
MCVDGILHFLCVNFLLYTNIKKKIYRNMDFRIFLGCALWSVTSKGRRCRLKMFDNTTLRNSLELKTEEVSGLWVKLHNEKLYGM